MKEVKPLFIVWLALLRSLVFLLGELSDSDERNVCSNHSSAFDFAVDGHVEMGLLNLKHYLII